MRRFNYKCLFFVLLCLGTTVFANALSFDERVAAQRAIEEVYWRHTIWPAVNPQPKPELNAIISDKELRLKVENYLRKSNALAESFQESITKEKLQAEIDRIAKETKDPQVLRELFGALQNDPYLIAECLTRPILVDRFAKQQNGFEAWFRQHHREVSLLSNAPAGIYHLPEIKTPGSFDPYSPEMIEKNSWTPTSTTGAPDARAGNTAVWTGMQMIVWGGGGTTGLDLNTGGLYTPSTDSWTALSTTGAPSPRGNHSAVWTGTEMIIWGGTGNTVGKFLRTGGRYNPSTDTWTATKKTGAPSARYAFTGVWTGKQLIIWGGFNNKTRFKTGARYSPSTNSWTPTSTTGAPAARDYHTAIWTDSEMIVWGGFTSTTGLTNTGGRYDPSTNSWTPTNTNGAPSPRTDGMAVWTGKQVIIWGGEASSGSGLKTGGIYTPSNDSWTQTATARAPSGRIGQVAVWTGTQMIVWGGISSGINGVVLKTGGRYNPLTDTWKPTAKTGAPSGRYFHAGVWTGTQMIIWGGRGNGGLEFDDTGGLYTP